MRQIAQECIPESHRGRVNGQWKALISFFDMLSYVVAMVFDRPSEFVYLTSLSAIMVFVALVLYTMTYLYGGNGGATVTRQNSAEEMDSGKLDGSPQETHLLSVVGQGQGQENPNGEALNSRRDRGNQPNGSVLGDRDFHPSVVARTNPLSSVVASTGDTVQPPFGRVEEFKTLLQKQNPPAGADGVPIPAPGGSNAAAANGEKSDTFLCKSIDVE